MKKRKGSIINAISGIFVLLTVAILTLSCLYILQVASLKEDIRQIARGYVLEMETVGYLTPESRSALILELGNKKLTNIDLAGSSFSAVGYGNDIVLSIKGTLSSRVLDTSAGDMLSFLFVDDGWDISVYLQSTAKY